MISPCHLKKYTDAFASGLAEAGFKTGDALAMWIPKDTAEAVRRQKHAPHGVAGGGERRREREREREWGTKITLSFPQFFFLSLEVTIIKI